MLKQSGFFVAALAAVCLAAGGVAAQEVHRVHGHTLVGELKYGPGFEHWDYVNPDAPKGGQVTQYAIGDYDSFNPFILEGRAAAGLGFIWETLMAGNEDEMSAHYGLLAEWMEYPDDFSWVTFKVRDEARWWDGQPVTSEDLIWTYETLLSEGHPYFAQYWGDIIRAEDLGDNQVRFYFNTENLNRELPHIAGQLYILPKHYYEEHTFNEVTLVPPMGSGPYRIASFEAPSSITYELVEDYWGRDMPMNLGTNNFGRITIDYYLDATIALEAFKAGEYDFRSENVAKSWALDYASPALERGLIIQAEIPHSLPSGMQGFYINLRKPKFQDRRVRQALQYTFDFEWSNNTLFYGQYTRTNSYFENSELASSGVPEGLELEYLSPHKGVLPDELFTTEFDNPKSDGTGNNRVQLQRAQELLAEAGWTVQNGRLVNANGEQLAIEVLLIQPAFERVVGPMVQNMQRLGINATYRTVETAQYQERYETYDFDMVVDTVSQSLSPGNEQRAFFGCSSAQEEGGANVSGVCDPVVEDLIQKVISAPDREHLVAATHALDRVLLWNYYVIPNWHISMHRLAYWDKFGRPEQTPDVGVGTSAWWVDASKAAAIQSARASLTR